MVRTVLLAIAFVSLVWSQTDPLRAEHNALFAMFLPIDELQREPQLGPMFTAAREGIWSAANQAPAFRALLQPFTDLAVLGKDCGVKDTGTFSHLEAARQRHVLFQLQSCRDNEARRLAMSVRNFYVVQAYKNLQDHLTGVNLALHAPAEFIQQHQPKLPPTRLRYDAARKEIVSSSGEIDYLVAGSGPAGSVLAHELRRGGRRVVLLERGSFIVPGSMETRLIDGLIDTRTSIDGGIRIRNGMAVGGGSQVNVDLCFAPTLPSIQAKIDLWRTAGRIAKTDFTMAELASAYEWVKSAIGTRVLSESEINGNNRVLWGGAKLAGLHPKLYDLNTYPPGQSPYPVTDKRSAESELVLKALQDDPNPLSLIPDADVRRVLFETTAGVRRAIGVEIRLRAPIQEPGVIADPNGLRLPPGETLQIRARNVILSAGALGSAAVLLRSGIDNDEIGRGVVLHASMPILGLFDRTIDALSGTQASVFVDDALRKEGYALESMSDQPLYAALMSPGPPMHVFNVVKSYRHLAGFGVMLIDTPSPENRVTIDFEGEPRVAYTLSEEDKGRFRRGVAQAVRIMFLAGAKQVYLPTTEDILGGKGAGELQPVVLKSAREAERAAGRLEFIPNRTIVTSAHMQATNKMGSTATNSVVSREFRVWGTERLYVVDGSVFPTSIGANPMQSIYTFAKIFADRMKDAK